MKQENVFVIMVGICVLVLLIGVLKQKAAIVLNLIVRVVVGCVGIILLNDFLQKQGIPVAAGLNPLNLLTIGSLGTSGFALIYGILFYTLL
ncbi:MAG: transcriptional regulator [Eubacterium sp.]|jgi:SigmaK-factor processing regulatory protein BofA.|nr:transcriptional regulator [Eubacterium sp.]